MDYFGHGIGDADREDGVYDLADERLSPAHQVAPSQEDYGYVPSEPIGKHVSGTQLRRRLITPEAIAAIHEEVPKKSLVQGILSRMRKPG